MADMSMPSEATPIILRGGRLTMATSVLPTSKMMGLESCGMLLSATHTEKGQEVLNLIMVDDKIPAGAKLC